MNESRGNALFLILIAVALFAALSYAITSSDRNNGNANRERAELGAARILSHAGMIDSAVQRLMLTNNVQAYNIYFNNDASKKRDGVSYTNNAMGSPANPALYLFHPSGGGVLPLLFTDLSASCASCGSGTSQSGHFAVRWSNAAGLGTSTGDLFYIVGYLSEDVCLAINSKSGITSIPIVAMANGIPVVNTAPPTLAFPTGAGVAAITGKLDICFINGYATADQGYYYYHVISLN